jgi:hypothetical protein
MWNAAAVKINKNSGCDEAIMLFAAAVFGFRSRDAVTD